MRESCKAFIDTIQLTVYFGYSDNERWGHFLGQNYHYNQNITISNIYCISKYDKWRHNAKDIRVGHRTHKLYY